MISTVAWWRKCIHCIHQDNKVDPSNDLMTEISNTYILYTMSCSGIFQMRFLYYWRPYSFWNPIFCKTVPFLTSPKDNTVTNFTHTRNIWTWQNLKCIYVIIVKARSFTNRGWTSWPNFETVQSMHESSSRV